jgi:hypothetical protein
MSDKRTKKTISKPVVAPKRVVDTEAARHERITERAHARWIARGCLDGYALEDWLAAESEA